MRQSKTSKKILDGWGFLSTKADQSRLWKTRATVNRCLQTMKQVSQIWNELTSFLYFKNTALKSEISKMSQENKYRTNKRRKASNNGTVAPWTAALDHHTFPQGLTYITSTPAMILTLSWKWSSVTPEPNPLAQRPTSLHYFLKICPLQGEQLVFCKKTVSSTDVFLPSFPEDSFSTWQRELEPSKAWWFYRDIKIRVPKSWSS